MIFTGDLHDTSQVQRQLQEATIAKGDTEDNKQPRGIHTDNVHKGVKYTS